MPMCPSSASSSSSSFFSFTITYFLILVSLTPLTPILSEQSQALFFCEQVKSDKVSLKEDKNQSKNVSGCNSYGEIVFNERQLLQFLKQYISNSYEFIFRLLDF